MKICCLLIILFFFVSAEAQIATSTNQRDSLNIYYQSLLQYFKYLKYNKQPLPDSIYLESDFKLATDSILFKIGEVKVVKVDYEQLVQLFKTHKSLTVYRLFPLKLKNKLFSVSCIPFGVSYNKSKRNMYFGNGGGFEILFNYINGEFDFLKVNVYGI